MAGAVRLAPPASGQPLTKVWPHHATREGTVQACQGSLRRLNTGWIDLYLLHWRGPVPLAETLEAFRDLRNAGLIRNWGVSNFDVSDLDDLMSLPGSLHVATDQVLYNLSRRAPEFDLFPACRELGIPIMAYSPVEQAVYFRRDQHLEPFIVQAVWLVGTLAALLISARRLGRGPAQ